MENLLPPHGVQPAVFARMTGIPLRRLRHYDRRGLFPAGQVDPVTGRRRYDPGQVGQGRLLQALHATGMEIEQAVAIAREGRRAAVLDHLARVQEHVVMAREHLPPPGPDEVRTTRVVAGSAMTMMLDATPGDDLLGVVRGVRRRLAAALGVSVEALPRRPDPGDLPDGMWVELEVVDDTQAVGRRVLAPHPRGTALPAGWEPIGTEEGSCGVVDLAAPDAALLPPALQLLQDWLDGPGGGFPIQRLLALDGDLTRASLVARIAYWRRDEWWR